MFRRHADRDPFVLDNVADTVSLWCDWAETKQTKSRITAIRCGEDGCAEEVVSWVREEGGDFYIRAALRFSLDELVHGIEVSTISDGVSRLACPDPDPGSTLSSTDRAACKQFAER